MHFLTRCGMDESDGLGLQLQTISLPAIEFITKNGTAQTIGMGTVHAQLVGPSRMRPKGEACHR